MGMVGTPPVLYWRKIICKFLFLFVSITSDRSESKILFTDVINARFVNFYYSTDLHPSLDAHQAQTYFFPLWACSKLVVHTSFFQPLG